MTSIWVIEVAGALRWQAQDPHTNQEDVVELLDTINF